MMKPSNVCELGMIAHDYYAKEDCGIIDGTRNELYDMAQQHLRALKAMKCDSSGEFITTLLELKLDPSTIKII